MPIGAFIARPALWEIFKDNPLLHTSTFGGNPLACVAALTALDVIEDEELAAKAHQRGAQLAKGISAVAAEWRMVVHVRARGLLLGLHFTDSDIGGLFISALIQRGILTSFALNEPKVIRFEPPAVISAEQVDQVVTAVGGALAQTAELLALQ